MRELGWKKLISSTAAVTALALALAGCGAGSNGANQAEGAEEPASGFEADYKGAYPMPSKTKAYDNTQDRDNVKDGGTLNIATTYTPNWNSMSVEGNTGYMSMLWSWYMPQVATLDLKGNLTWNKDYITKVEKTSENPLTIKFTLNDQAKWNDGTDFDWTAFESTWKVMNGQDANYSPASTEGFEDIESVTQGATAKEAVVTFKQPFYPWESLFTSLYPPQALDANTYTNGWIDNPHPEWGAGPFTVQSADKDSVTFVRNEKWWGNKPKLDKVVVKYMEATAEVNAFKNGELDATDFSNNNTLQTVKSRKDIQIRLGYDNAVAVYMLNGKSEHLKDDAVRKAVVQAFDRETMNKVRFQGLNWTPEEPGSEVFPVYEEGYENNLPEEAKKVDTKGAKATLESDGYKMGSDGYYAKGGKTLDIRYTYFSDSAVQTNMAKAFAQMMKAAGIKVTLENRDGSKFSDTVNNGDYEVLPMAWQSNSPWGQVNITQLYGSKSESNYSFIGSDEVDKLAQVPGTIPDQLEAVKAANKAEKAALKLFGSIPISISPKFTAVTKGLANWGPSGFKTTLPENVGWQK
ncbi:ABC transporter family substrate-binding protein [Alloscardovia macacae]|uniref:ABC transporter substrate-binding protein n=1 Tax=Alloscardovia macacae TaxID=1160091 RepID=A0A261F6Q3_9BIFI|nr:ABC transporter family substrate-binding protein [Alloscardovia macacae]OZG54820.1 ABC transporter substrate-binding protein [Alloscardovia macacae]